MLLAMLVAFTAVATSEVQAQEPSSAPAPGGPPLGSFAAMRVAIVPVQLWRADSVGWSKEVDWAALRAEFDAAVGDGLRERGLGSRWAYPADVVRSARRNPTYSTDPFALGVGRWRAIPPKIGEDLPALIADNLRPLTALGDARYALIPVELRTEAEAVIVRLVLVDARIRSVLWVGDIGVTAGRDFAPALAGRIADLIVEP
jgi:hypothetical protein